MKIFEKNLKLTPIDNQTNIKFPFILHEDYTTLIINFTYTPRLVPDEIAYEKIIQTICRDIEKSSKNYQEMMNKAKEMKLENLITISLSCNNEYLGAYHNKRDLQKNIISKDFASEGFNKIEIVKGDWEVQLNAHHIGCDIEVSLSVEVE